MNKPKSSETGNSIWQQYMAAAFGNPTLNPNDIVGKTYFAAEGFVDELKRKGVEYAQIVGRVTENHPGQIIVSIG